MIVGLVVTWSACNNDLAGHPMDVLFNSGYDIE